MKKLKTFLALFTVVAMLFALTACGGSGSGSSNVSIPTVDKMTIYDKDDVTIKFDGIGTTDETKYMLEHGKLVLIFEAQNKMNGCMFVSDLCVNGHKISYIRIVNSRDTDISAAAVSVEIEDLKKAGIKNVDNITVSLEMYDTWEKDNLVYETGPITVDFTK